MYYLVEFTGPFAYLKPWSAVRDGKTCSLQFLTFSTLEGIRRKLGVSAIPRYRLSWGGVDWQQEVTQPRDYERGRGGVLSRPRSVLERGILLAPRLVLALPTETDAEQARHQHVCLSRNEDLLLPLRQEPIACTPEAFDLVPGAELRRAAAGEAGAILVGHDRYADFAPMFGQLTYTLEQSSPDYVY